MTENEKQVGASEGLETDECNLDEGLVYEVEVNARSLV